MTEKSHISAAASLWAPPSAIFRITIFVVPQVDANCDEAAKECRTHVKQTVREANSILQFAYVRM